MNTHSASEVKLDEASRISPDYVRISMAAAIELGLKPGRINGCSCNCINLLQNYPQGCYANCTYCGLARERPGAAQDNSFIRVGWPLFPTDLVAEKIAELENRKGVGRVCVAQVQDHRANRDLVDMTSRVRRQAPEVPISALVTATLLNDDWLSRIKDAGADIIGVGLDAASEELFYSTRGKGTKGPHEWKKHWRIIRKAREMFGPMKVNCHLILGLLIEEHDLLESALEFDESGAIRTIDAPRELLERVTQNGLAFMTDGCPDRQGEMACNRPYGSYRPGEEFRDYPFLPKDEDLRVIRVEMKLNEVVKPTESAVA